MSMRTFVLQRDTDVTGVSGTGIVADGVQFDDGRVVLYWRGDLRSVVVWDHLASVEVIHGHDGATRIIFTDGEPGYAS